MITRQISPADLSSLVAAADVIVRVVVNSESPRLSENQLHIVSASEANFTPFRIGEEFVLFLSRHTDRRRYVIAYGPQGAFRRTDGFVGPSPLGHDR